MLDNLKHTGESFDEFRANQQEADSFQVGRYTPAPWCNVAIPYDTQKDIETPSGEIICTVRKGNTEANARLIAAAPELLEALIDAVDSIEQLDSGEWEPDNDAMGSALQGYRKVISKAKGE